MLSHVAIYTTIQTNAQADKQKTRLPRHKNGLSTDNVENIRQNKGPLNAATFTIRISPCNGAENVTVRIIRMKN